MVSERAVKISHTVIFVLVLVASIIALAISGSLVGHYNNDGYPPVHTGAYEARIRICLVASVWTTAIASECLNERAKRVSEDRACVRSEYLRRARSATVDWAGWGRRVEGQC